MPTQTDYSHTVYCLIIVCTNRVNIFMSNLMICVYNPTKNQRMTGSYKTCDHSTAWHDQTLQSGYHCHKIV